MYFDQVKSFSKTTAKLRKHFESVFFDPNKTDRRRLCFDPWYLKDTFYILRTPAWEFFPKALYHKIHKELVMFGRKNLCCWEISPTWLSLYLEGHYQNVHVDKPHGPFAFVLSLCNPRKFKGGKTFIYESQQRRGTQKISPEFNTLTLFDPAQKHGVTPVRGPKDPVDGRLVIHGWFQKPLVQIYGGLNLPGTQQTRFTHEAIQNLSHKLVEGFREQNTNSIFLTVKIQLSPAGAIQNFEIPICTHSKTLKAQVTARLQKLKNLKESLFPKTKEKSQIIIPIQI